MDLKILASRRANQNDVVQVFDLYKIVSKIGGGLARDEYEISEEYVANFSENAQKNGVQFVVVENANLNKIVAEIHCYKLKPKIFEHILAELTIAVHPDFQGQGIGKMLFQEMLEFIKNEMPNVLRVELIARESNFKAIEMYKKLGFKVEGFFESRIKTGTLEADIPMAWFNPNYSG